MTATGTKPKNPCRRGSNFAISSFRCSISASARVRAARSSANVARKAAISAAGLEAADIMGGSEPEPAPARQPCSST